MKGLHKDLLLYLDNTYLNNAVYSVSGYINLKRIEWDSFTNYGDLLNQKIYRNHLFSNLEPKNVFSSDLTLKSKIEFLEKELPLFNFTLSSKIKTKEGNSKYIKMLDFANKPEVVIENIITFLKRINEHGIVVKTKNSFHFYGKKLCDQPFDLNFYGNVLLSQLGDNRWIAHQFVEGCASLRIGTKVLEDGSRLSDLEIIAEV